MLSWLFEQQNSGISLGLDGMRELLSVLGNPQDRVPCLHIAGTNGKGSVSAFAASILKAAGLRVGLYTSPHLVDFRERIQMNGELISLEALEIGIQQLQAVTQDWKTLPTFFELTTALAFDYFAQQKCDVIVLETGLGGRLDATNLATNKIACAITSISLDHQDFLGLTLAAITREKAGIMRANVPTVTLPQAEEVMLVLQEEATRVGAPLEIALEPIGSEIALGLVGGYQRWNAAVALTLIQQGPWSISHEAILTGLKNVSWPGRFQCFQLESSGDLKRFLPLLKVPQEEATSAATLILDGAHNPAAAEQLLKTWNEVFPGQKCSLVFGALRDKAGEQMLRLLEPIAASISLVSVHSPRTASPAELQKIVPSATTFASLKEVFKEKNIFREKALHFSSDLNYPVLLTGSLFLVGEALALLQGRDHSSFSQ